MPDVFNGQVRIPGDAVNQCQIGQETAIPARIAATPCIPGPACPVPGLLHQRGEHRVPAHASLLIEMHRNRLTILVKIITVFGELLPSQLRLAIAPCRSKGDTLPFETAPSGNAHTEFKLIEQEIRGCRLQPHSQFQKHLQNVRMVSGLRSAPASTSRFTISCCGVGRELFLDSPMKVR